MVWKRVESCAILVVDQQRWKGANERRPADTGQPVSPMHTTITQLVESYGYWFLFALVAIESFGIPLPGETGRVTAAAFVRSGR